jgi:hypothetical protein
LALVAAMQYDFEEQHHDQIFKPRMERTLEEGRFDFVSMTRTLYDYLMNYF